MKTSKEPSRSSQTTIESDTEDKKDEAARLRRYREIVTAFKRDADEFFTAGRRIEQIYRAKSPGDKGRKPTFNSLWSNVTTLGASVFSRLPKVIVERRAKETDPVSLVACKLLERATSFQIMSMENDWYFAINDAVRDRNLGGIGIGWVRYEPRFREVVDEATQLPVETDEGTPLEEVEWETCAVDYIHPRDFGWNSDARNWFEVRKIWKERHFTRRKLKEKWPDKWRTIPLDAFEDNVYENESDGHRQSPRATIIELWDLDTKEVVWFCKGGGDEFLDVTEDPLGLRKFFPVPRPLLGTTASDKIFPTPDYEIYEPLAAQLDDCVRRAGALTSMVRLTGAHAGSINEDLSKLRTAPDGYTIPIMAWDTFKQGGGFQGVIQWIPINDVASALQQLDQRSQSLQAKIDLITGMSDIIRGGSNPYETLGAQKIKDNWASKKIKDRQQEVQRFVKDLAEAVGEIIARKFSDATILETAGAANFSPQEQSFIPAALELLRNDKFRTFRISIETDSTLALHDSEDQSMRMEAVTAVGNILQQASQMLQLNPAWEPIVLQALQFGIRSYREGREFEMQVQQAIDAYEQAKNQPPPPPQPSPEEQKMQMEAQIAQAKLQLESQVKQSELQVAQFIAQKEAEIKQFKAQTDLQVKEEKLQLNSQLQAEKLRADFAAKQMEMISAQQNAGGVMSNPQLLNLIKQFLLILGGRAEEIPLIDDSQPEANSPVMMMCAAMQQLAASMAQSQENQTALLEIQTKLLELQSKPRVAEFQTGPDGSKKAVSYITN